MLLILRIYVVLKDKNIAHHQNVSTYKSLLVKGPRIQKQTKKNYNESINISKLLYQIFIEDGIKLTE